MELRVPRHQQLALLAAKQYGHVTRLQLIGLGYSRNQISNLLTAGYLFLVHRNVYAVGHPRLEAIARAAAAVLACGPDAVLSHHSAAALWGLTRWPATRHVTVPAKRRPAGIRVHLCPTLDRRDTRRHQGIRVTSPARTLIDVAPDERAINEALVTKLVRPDQLHAVAKRYPSHPGSSFLSQYLSDSPGPTRSKFERLFVKFCREYGLPTPKMNTRVAGYEVDALFEAERVAVELDSWQYHKGHGSFESDRDRDAAMLEAQIITIRITWARLTRQPAREAARLMAILESRR
jgi:very-short-patch-repair endonuclease